MKAIASVCVAGIVLLAAVVVVGWQRARISSLEAERAALQAQSEQPPAAPETKPASAEQVSAVPAPASSADMDELLRLRAQASRLRQLEEENAVLRSELQRVTGRASPGSAASAHSGSQSTPAAPDAKPVSSTDGTTDLGVLEFTEGTPKRFDLGDGRTCTVTPVILLNDKLTVELKIDSPDAKDPSVFRVVANAGKQVAVFDSNGKMIVLTPTIKTQ